MRSYKWITWGTLLLQRADICRGAWNWKRCTKHSLSTSVTKQIQRQDKNKNVDLKTEEKTKTKSEGQLKDVTNYAGQQLKCPVLLELMQKISLESLEFFFTVEEEEKGISGKISP